LNKSAVSFWNKGHHLNPSPEDLAVSMNRLPANLNSRWARILADPYYRFKSVQEVQMAAQLGVQIDVNQATVDDWLRLPGVSIHQARSLVQLTRSGVQFHCLEDIAAALGLPSHRLQPLAAILQFCYYDPDSVCGPGAINVNLASVEVLAAVPRIDSTFAKAIVANRQAKGPYRNLADFQARLYVPGAIITELMHYLQF
jgi:DNA uptake protein ComE-like DNA-binding protein